MVGLCWCHLGVVAVWRCRILWYSRIIIGGQGASGTPFAFRMAWFQPQALRISDFLVCWSVRVPFSRRTLVHDLALIRGVRVVVALYSWSVSTSPSRGNHG